MSAYEQTVRRHLPAARTLTPIETGWDSIVVDVDDEWIFRFARRSEVAEWLRREARLLPPLAAALPLPVPCFEFVGEGYTAHRKLRGRPLPADAPPHLGGELGAFLRALHAFPNAPLPNAEWMAQQRAFAARCDERVLPLLAPEERAAARRMFDEFFAVVTAFEPTLVHGDLGPEHILVSGDSVSGVIDWSDARVGDPALDLAWLLNGTNDAFAQSLLDAYGDAGAGLLSRALFYHRLGPWHEVVYGRETGRGELVESGLAGVRARLP